MLGDRLVSLELGLDNPDRKLPQEIGSIVYVTCTRVTKLQHLFVSPILPAVWDKIGKSNMDVRRRTMGQQLQSAAESFAVSHGKHDEMKTELSWIPDYSGNDVE